MIDFDCDISAAEKLRNIVNWLNYQDENFNDKMRTIKTIVQLYDLCQEEGFEFADDLISYLDEDGEETRKFAQKVNKILGFTYYDF